MPDRQVEKSHAIGALVLGVIEVICGVIIIILSVVIGSKASVNAAVSPYWAGIVFVIPGIIGVVVMFTKNNCAMISFMVMNIIAFVVQGVGAVLVGIAVAVWLTVAADVSNNCIKTYNTCHCFNGVQGFALHGVNGSCDIVSTLVNMAIGIIVMLVIAAIASLAASILGCVSVCCSNRNSQPGTVIQQNMPMH